MKLIGILVAFVAVAMPPDTAKEDVVKFAEQYAALKTLSKSKNQEAAQKWWAKNAHLFPSIPN